MLSIRRMLTPQKYAAAVYIRHDISIRPIYCVCTTSVYKYSRAICPSRELRERGCRNLWGAQLSKVQGLQERNPPRCAKIRPKN